MNPVRQLFIPAFLGLLCVVDISAQTPAHIETPLLASKSAATQEPTQENLDPKQGWPSPVDDRQRYTFILADVLEYRPKGNDSDFRWDVEGWHGGDFNRLWFKSEGERNTALKAEYDIDAQLLYGRFVRKYYDFQLGLRAETQNYQGRNVTRAHAVIGIEGLVPYRYEFESAVFISQNGDLSGRLSFSRDLLITQRLILQPRLETNVAAQTVERFTVGRGLNNIEFGMRLRYEFRRKFGPYAGISFDRSFFGTADLVRQEGGDPGQIRFVVGVRMWR
jgi:copper resistance protein B